MPYSVLPTDHYYVRPTAPVRIPTPDGKLIEEHLGLASTGTSGYSLAHMVAPPGWSEPPQRPEFDEITIVVRGRKVIEVEGEALVLEAGQSLLTRANALVRYANPYAEECEYWSVCVPAFDLATVNRAPAPNPGQ